MIRILVHRRDRENERKWERKKEKRVSRVRIEKSVETGMDSARRNASCVECKTPKRFYTQRGNQFWRSWTTFPLGGQTYRNPIALLLKQPFSYLMAICSQRNSTKHHKREPLRPQAFMTAYLAYEYRKRFFFSYLTILQKEKKESCHTVYWVCTSVIY